MIYDNDPMPGLDTSLDISPMDVYDSIVWDPAASFNDSAVPGYFSAQDFWPNLY